MQPSLTYSWIALTASAPVILLLTCWTLISAHCRRRRWTTVDIFLVAILSQSVIQQFLGFIYSTLVLLKVSTPLTGEAVCTGMMWFFITIPIFKGTTITSLAIDRWIFLTRFSYRLSIRKSHVRYHIAVLGILSSIVGFTGLITFNNPELLSSTASPLQYSFEQCTFLPFKFDVKFVIFYLSVHSIILLVGTVTLFKAWCKDTADSQLLSSSHPKKVHYKRRRSSPSLDVTPTLSNTSTASSTVSNGSPTTFFSPPGLAAKAVLNGSQNISYHNHHSRNPSRSVFYGKNDKERATSRLSPSLGLLILTIICTHLAFMIATILSRLDVIVPSVDTHSDDISILNWPVTNLLLWLQVIEGLSTILVLFIVDPVVPTWIFNRTNGKDLDDSSKVHNSYSIGGPRGSPRHEEDGYHHNPQLEHLHLNNRSGLSDGNSHYANPAFSPEFRHGSKFPLTNGSLFVGPPGSTPPNNAALPTSSSQNGPRCPPVLHSHIPAHRMPTVDYESIGGIFQEEDESEYDRKSYHHRYASVASVTTVANDDFEFHQSRPSVFPCPAPPTPTPNKDYNASTYVVPKSHFPPSHPILTFNGRKLSEKEKAMNPHIYEKFDPRNKYHPVLPYQKPQSGIGTGLNQPTSLSMNDLDLIDPRTTTERATRTPVPLGTPEPFEQKQRMYRKRGRVQYTHHVKPLNERRSTLRYNNEGHSPYVEELSSSPSRRVLSMECLSPSKKQTERNSNLLDISYMDTGEILVRKADSSKCIFVTDFI